MGYNPIADEEIESIFESSGKLKLLLDSNVLIAYLDNSHKFNYEAKAIIDPLKDKDCYFFIHYLVLGEFINKWIELKKSGVAEAIKILEGHIFKKLKYTLIGGVPMHSKMIFSIFKKHARHKKFIQAHFNDFMILTGVENIKNIKIVTCDKAMHEAGKSIFKKTFIIYPLKHQRVKVS